MRQSIVLSLALLAVLLGIASAKSSSSSSRSLYFAGQMVMSDSSDSYGLHYASFGEFQLHDNEESGVFKNTGTGIFDSSIISRTTINQRTSQMYFTGNFLWVDQTYSSVVASLNTTTNRLSGMNKGLWSTYQPQLLGVLENDDVIVAGFFSFSESNPSQPLKNIAIYRPSQNQWLPLADPTNAWTGGSVSGLAVYKGTAFVYTNDGFMYRWFDPQGWENLNNDIQLEFDSLIADFSGNLYGVHQKIIDDGAGGSVMQDSVWYWKNPDYSSPPKEYIVRSSSNGCTPTIVKPFANGVIVAVAQEQCDHWQFVYYDGEGFSNNTVEAVNQPVTVIASSNEGDVFIAGPMSLGNDIAQYWSGAFRQWKPISFGVQNYTVNSMIFCEKNRLLYIDIVNNDNTTRSMITWNPANGKTGTVINSAQLVRPGVVNGLAQLSTGEIGVAGMFEYAGKLRTRNAAYWDGAEWNSLNFEFANARELPSGISLLAALGTNWYAVGSGVCLTKDQSMPFYYRSISGAWQVMPKVPTFARDDGCPTIHSIYADESSIYFGGQLNANINGAESLGLIAYNTSTKSWRSFGIPKDSWSGSVFTITRISHYLLLGGSFSFNLNGIDFKDLAAYNLYNNTWFTGAVPVGDNTVFSFGYYPPKQQPFIFGNLKTQTPGQPLESIGALVYEYATDSFTDAPISPTVLASAWTDSQLWIGGSFHSTDGWAGLARWNGQNWVGIVNNTISVMLEGNIKTMLYATPPTPPKRHGDSSLPGWAVALITIFSIGVGLALIAGIAAIIFVQYRRRTIYQTL